MSEVVCEVVKDFTGFFECRCTQLPFVKTHGVTAVVFVAHVPVFLNFQEVVGDETSYRR